MASPESLWFLIRYLEQSIGAQPGDIRDEVLPYSGLLPLLSPILAANAAQHQVRCSQDESIDAPLTMPPGVGFARSSAVIAGDELDATVSRRKSAPSGSAGRTAGWVQVNRMGNPPSSGSVVLLVITHQPFDFIGRAEDHRYPLVQGFGLQFQDTLTAGDGLAACLLDDH